MPQDTIWLNPEKTDFIIESALADSSQNSTQQQYIPAQDYTKAKSDEYSQWAFPGAIMLLAAIWIIIRIRDGKSRGYVEIGSGSNASEEEYINENENESTETTEPYLVYNGDDLNFSSAELIAVLNKRSAYFTRLNPFEKDKFINRLKQFISGKIYNIHDESGFKEMPILISASAIQLSFGLENYLLPDFAFINIFPQEFLGVHPNIRFLEGNVSGNSINISWKHFLTGFEIPDDGQNVGLHEMAHAYYFQNLVCKECEDKEFKETFSLFEQTGNKVFVEEKEPGKDFYSEYAMRNFQEFWAESIEIFFEKPVMLKRSYPELYDAISDLLNQDTVRMAS